MIDKFEKFYILYDMLQKYNFADMLYKKLDKTNDGIVAPIHWCTSIQTTNYISIQYWISIIYSIYEGLTKSFDDHTIVKKQTDRQENVLRVFGDIKKLDWIQPHTKIIELFDTQKISLLRHKTYHINKIIYESRDYIFSDEHMNIIECFFIDLGTYLKNEIENIYIELLNNYDEKIFKDAKINPLQKSFNSWCVAEEIIQNEIILQKYIIENKIY